MLWQNGRENDLKEDIIILVNGFGGLGPLPLSSFVWDSVSLPWRGHGTAEITSGFLESRERERMRDWGQGLVTKDLILSTRSHLLSFHHSLSNYESINELIHAWGQRHHDPIISQEPHLWTRIHRTKPWTYEPLWGHSRPYHNTFFIFRASFIKCFPISEVHIPYSIRLYLSIPPLL